MVPGNSRLEPPLGLTYPLGVKLHTPFPAIERVSLGGGQVLEERTKHPVASELMNRRGFMAIIPVAFWCWKWKEARRADALNELVVDVRRHGDRREAMPPVRLAGLKSQFCEKSLKVTLFCVPTQSARRDRRICWKSAFQASES